MKGGSIQIVRRYSVALLECALDSGDISEITEEVLALKKILENVNLSVFSDPLVSEVQKFEMTSLLTSEAKLTKTTSNFLKLLVENSRFHLVSEILGEFLSQTDIRLGVCRAELITARPVSQAQASEFEVHLGKCLNKKTILSSRIDTTLKAGYIVKIGNTLIDASLKTKLSRLKDTLIQGV